MNEQTPINPIAQILWTTANDQQKSFLRALVAGSLYNDYCTLQNVLSSPYPPPKIQQKIIDNSEEYYKQLNKSLLIFRDLSSPEKLCEELKIDVEAGNLKNKWVRALRNRSILIINS